MNQVQISQSNESTIPGVLDNTAEMFRVADHELTKIFPKRRIERVLFIVPPDADATMFNYDTAKRGRYWNYPPYGSGVLSSHLRKDGLEPAILNLNHTVLKTCRLSKAESEFNFDATWKAALAEKLADFKPDLVGVTCMFSQTHASTVAVVNDIKRLYPKQAVALGGVHITNCLVSEKLSGPLLEDLQQADFFFTYEAEIALKEFTQIVNKKSEITNLSQVYFNSCEGKLYFAKKMTPVLPEELNVVPAQDLMNISELSDHGTIGSFYCLREEGTKFSTVLANRGCRARCTFCSVRNFNGEGVRSRAVQSVIDELKHLKQDHGVTHVMWLDDDFLIGHERALELFREMIRQDVGMTWDCTNGVIAASCTDELMAAAAASGCLGFNIGMESGNTKILREIKKPGTVETFLRAAEVLRKYEQINARVFLMIGFPGETYQMILDTINVALKMDLDWYNITILQPLPNTPIFNAMVTQGLLNEVNFQEIRYNSGAYGKHRKLAEQKNTDMLSSDFQNAFSGDLGSIPPREKLDDVWAYMNYHLNFKRLFHETRQTKLVQQLKYVRNITDLVAPENAFAMYFYGYLQQKIYGKIEPLTIIRLEEHLASSPYWQKRFDDFQLSIDHLKIGKFPVS